MQVLVISFHLVVYFIFSRRTEQCYQCFQNPNPVSHTQFSGDFGWYKQMGKNTAISLHTSFSNATDDSDKARSCWLVCFITTNIHYWRVWPRQTSFLLGRCQWPSHFDKSMRESSQQRFTEAAATRNNIKEEYQIRCCVVKPQMT